MLRPVRSEPFKVKRFNPFLAAHGYVCLPLIMEFLKANKRVRSYKTAVSGLLQPVFHGFRSVFKGFSMVFAGF